jgi:hypothetical protein
MPERLSSQSTTTEDVAIIAIDHRNPLTFWRETADIHAEDSSDQACRHEEGGDDGEHMQIAVGLLSGLDGDLLLQKLSAVAQGDDLGVEPI